MKTFPMSNLEKAILDNRFRRYQRYVLNAKASPVAVGSSIMTYTEWDNFIFNKETPSEKGRE